LQWLGTGEKNKNARGNRNQEWIKMISINKYLLIVIICLLLTSNCFADAGLPMFVIQFPFALFAVIPVILIESFILKKMMKLSWKKVLIESTKANVVSTLIGYPLAWGFALGIELLTTGGSCGPGFNTFKDSLVTIIVEAAWLCPYEKLPNFVIPSMLLFLLTITWIISIFIEYKVLSLKKENKRIYLKPTIIMNSFSYLGLLIVAFFFITK
jgi:hypothetical protein